MTTEIFGLQWLEHPNIFNQAIVDLRTKNSFTDATLACEGKFYPVHKFVLSTCSEYFNAIFEWTPCVNPVVVINNISTHNLEPLLDFMYRGEANVQECNIQDVMKAAECLHIKGLSLHPEELNFAKNRPKSPVYTDESKKKRRRSETMKKESSFLKPLVQSENVYGHPVASPLQSSITSTRPTPTPPPTTPIHHSSPHHTPPVHSPSLHSASPLALSSTASSPNSQNQYQSPSFQIPSPKSLLSPVPNLMNQNQVKNVTHFKETVMATVSQMQEIPQQVENFTQSRDQYPLIKEDKTNLVYTSLTNVVSSSNPNALSASQESLQYRKYSNSELQGRIQEHGVASQTVSQIPVDQKLIGIGEELHLDGPVKELEITTEDGGTVSIPEILEGLVDMRQLYDSKSESYGSDAKQSTEPVPQCSNSTNPASILSYKEEPNESMYEFTEDFVDDVGTGKLKLMKEKSLKVYSNNGTNMKKRANSEQQPDSLPSMSSTLSGVSSGACSSPATAATPSSGEKKEAKGPFVCGTCSRVCKKKDSLTRHMRTHSEFPYTCTVCSHKCKMYKELILHRKSHATKRCDKCDFVTIRGDALRRHMQTHLEGKTRKCPYPDCDFSTNKTNLLNGHVQNVHVKKAKKEMEAEAEYHHQQQQQQQQHHHQQQHQQHHHQQQQQQQHHQQQQQQQQQHQQQQQQQIQQQH